MQNKGHSAASARKICGAMEQQINASVSTAAANNKLFVKAFLIDASLNINKWRVTKESIDKNINSFIGKPLVLTEQFDHPAPNNGQPESLNHWLSYQESFRVGTIIDITTKTNPSTGNLGYYAIIEVTNDDLKQSLKDNTVPLYVSPGIAELIPNAAVASRSLPAPEGDIISNWTAVHLAIVDEPAFGIKKAVISDQCGGDEKGCLLQLRKAHVDKHGVGKCGFCVKKALNSYRILRASVQSVQKAVNNDVIDHSQTGLTSLTVSSANQDGNYRKMSQLETTDPNSNTISTQQIPSAPQSQEQQQKETVEKVERPNTLTKAPIQHPPSTSSVPELTELIQRLRQENELLKIKNEELNNVKDTISERIAAIETERRRERIERIITPDIIRDDKTRLDKIKYFVASNIPIDQIEELYKDIKVTLRKASVSQQRIGRVPYLGSSMGTSGVASSANQQNLAIDEETGLTPLQKQLAVLRGGP